MKPSTQPRSVPSSQATSPASGAIAVPGPPVETATDSETATTGSVSALVGSFEGNAEVNRGKNVSLSRTQAANRARADLARQLRAAGQLADDAPLPMGVKVEYEMTAKRVRARATLP